MANLEQHRTWIFIRSRVAAVRLALAIVSLLTVVATPAAQAQTFSVVYNFTGGADGASPFAGLTIDGGGNFYGTTFAGGGGPCQGYGHNGCGTVFKLMHSGASWSLTPLYNFAGVTDGARPWAGVIVRPNGGLYGTTVTGGQGPCQGYQSSGCGTVFNLLPPPNAYPPTNWSETVLYRFSGGGVGALAYGKVVFDQTGSLYGTTNFGGAQGSCYQGNRCGTVWKLTPSGSGWTEQILYNFTGGADGGQPVAGLIFDQAGNLYGTTEGPSGHHGSVFQLTPSGGGWTENTLYSFKGGSDADEPWAEVIFDTSGNLYGTTFNFGVANGGTVFELTPSGNNWIYTLVYSLSGMGAGGPVGKVIMDTAGNLYGTTRNGGVSNNGAVFKLTPSGGVWAYASLHDFTGGSDGAYPYSDLVFDANGNLYGTASQGGDLSKCGGSGCGVVFEITPN